MASRRHLRANVRKTEFDLNIVPIVDCLTILLTFMLASGAFFSLGVLEIGVAGPSSASAEKKEFPIDLTLELNAGKSMTLAVSGKMRKRIPLAAFEGQWNFSKLTEELTKFAEEYPEVKSVNLLANQDLEYHEIVKAMEATKKSHPDVLLGGF
jgi:biopolymer transport protein TolR